jgi:hypothetical protein
MKKSTPPTTLVNQVLDKLRTNSKNKFDLKSTTGFQTFKKNLRNNSHSKKMEKSEKNIIKLSQDYESCKSYSKIKVSSTNRYNELQYGSEINNKNTSNSSIYKVNINTKESFALVNNKGKKSSLPINSLLSTRTNLVKPNLLTNMSVNNIKDLLPNSPSDTKLTPSVAQTSNFTKFNEINGHSRHKKGSKSVSYQFNISSMNMMKLNQEAHKNVVITNNNNLSYEEDKQQKPSKSRCIDKNDKLSYGNIDLLGLLSGNTKSLGKLSTDVSTISSMAISAKAKLSELEGPEELHFFYVKMAKDSKNLPYSVPAYKGYH